MNDGRTGFEPAYDAVVVGARVAGAATAMLLARAGLRVLAVDKGRPGSDTVSTHALMRGGVVQLDRWGVLAGVDAAGTPPIRSATFHYGAEKVPVPIEPRDGVDGLRAPRRTVLDTLLVDAARAAGAQVAHETRVTDLLRDAGGRVTGVTVAAADGAVARIAARIVIGADGARSEVARRAGAGYVRRARHAAAVAYGYWPDMDASGYAWHFGRAVSAGVIPTNDGLACVFAAMPPERFREGRVADLAALHRRVLAENDPALADAVAGRAPIGPMRAYPGVPGFIRQAWGPGWALVGDAGYFKDPITAHGMTDALRDAELLANAVARGGDDALAAYQAARDDLALEGLAISDELASYEWDMERAARLHRQFSRYMSREMKVIRALGGTAEAASRTG